MRHPVWYKCAVVCGVLLTMPCLIGLFMACTEAKISCLVLGPFGVLLYLVATCTNSPAVVLLALYLPPLAALVAFWRTPTATRAWLLFGVYNLYTLMPGVLIFAAMYTDVSSPLVTIAQSLLGILHLQ